VTEIYKSQKGKLAIEALYRDALQRWPVPSRQMVVPTRQGGTFVVACGDDHAAPIVLFHGSGTNSSVWIRDVADLAEHHRVYAVDMIGEPGFSAPSRPPLASDAYASWLDDVWNALGLSAASVVGVSLGGWLALDYAVRRPERVVSVSLLSPSGIGGVNTFFLAKVALLLLAGRWGRRRSFKLVAGPGRAREVSQFVTTVFQHFRPRLERVPIRTDEELSALRVPVQAIVGGKDALIRSKETRERLEALVPRVEVTYLEQEGHILPSQATAISQFTTAAWSPLIVSRLRES